MTRTLNASEPVAVDWLGKIVLDLPLPEDDVLEPVVQEFKSYIEMNPGIRILASTMFDNLPKQDPGGNPQIPDWQTMLQVMSRIITRAPSWSKPSYEVGQVGRPFNQFLNWPMATVSGAAFFLNDGVNFHLKRILSRWNTYLELSASASVLHENDWLSPHALFCIATAANISDGSTLTFDEIYHCDPSRPHYGFKCWDDFFTRRFRPGIRPIDSPKDDSVVVNPCEAKPFTLRSGIKFSDTFWIKRQPYSLQDLFSGSPISYMANSFISGSIFQAYLSTITYHRWHAPVSGTIKAHTVIDGTYFAIPAWVTGYAKPGGQADPLVMDNAQGYLAHVNTRAIIIIEADKPGIGMVAFIAVGMHEASSCAVDPDIASGKKRSIKKGEEIGMFHFGGSSYCILFQSKTKLQWITEVAERNDESKNLAINSALAYVRS
jgi:phosphatidylserine decarboxylase